MKEIRKRLKNGETLLGCWLNLGSATTAEMVASAGFDWLLIDLEHGAGNEQDALGQLRALEGGTAAGLVRVESGARQRIQRMLDCGAEGVMVPRIDSPAEAREATAALRYPPTGSRGVARMVRAAGFGKDFENYYEDGQSDILGIIQIETEAVLQHLDEVASIDGVDVLFIGPADLSAALGIIGQFEHPKFRDAVRLTAQAAEKAGKAAGVLLYGPEQFQAYHDLGFRLIACGADSAFVTTGAREMAGRLNDLRPKS